MDSKSNSEKWLCAAIFALLFIVISHPAMYKLVNMIYSSISGASFAVSDAAGCPTTFGLILHTIVFFLLARGIFEIPILKME